MAAGDDIAEKHNCNGHGIIWKVRILNGKLSEEKDYHSETRSCFYAGISCK